MSRKWEGSRPFENYIVCVNFKYMRSIQKVSIHALWKIDIYWRRYKKHWTQDNDTSVPFKVGTLGPHTVLPIAISWLIIFSWTHWQSEISFLSKVILVLGKARICRTPNLWRLSGVSHLGVLIFCQKTLQETWCMSRHVVLKLPITSCP